LVAGFFFSLRETVKRQVIEGIIHHLEKCRIIHNVLQHMQPNEEISFVVGLDKH
jgi:hypothetical protein